MVVLGGKLTKTGHCIYRENFNNHLYTSAIFFMTHAAYKVEMAIMHSVRRRPKPMQYPSYAL